MQDLVITFSLFYGVIVAAGLLALFFRYRSKSSRYMEISVWVICAHVIYKLVWMSATGGQSSEIPLPFGLLYPSLLYLFARSYYLPDRILPFPKFLLLLSPFALHVGLFAVACLLSSGVEQWGVYTKVYYVSCVPLVTACALLTACLYRATKGAFSPTDILIRQLTMLCFALVVLFCMLVNETYTGRTEFGIEARPMVNVFLVIGFALIMHYQRTHSTRKHGGECAGQSAVFSGGSDWENMPPDWDAAGVDPVAVRAVQRKLIDAKLFLSPSVSMDVLALQTSVPRYQLTQVFSQHYGKSFYQFIAEMRIEYALNRIAEAGDTLTLDSLSYECGFNSKTSFNRYFKEYTGLTPSEYRVVRPSRARKERLLTP